MIRTALVALATFVTLVTSGASVLPAQERPASAATEVRVTGVVVDSATNQPLAGAIVQLLPADDRSRVRTVLADSLGRYTFDAVAPGRWLLGFLHPRADALAGGAPTHLFTVRAGGGPYEMPLFLPSASAPRVDLLAYEEARGLVRGVVLDSANRPVADARITDENDSVSVRSDASGRFALPPLAAGARTLAVRAVGFAPQRFDVTVLPAQTLLLDLELVGLTPVLATVTASARRTIEGFHARRGQGRGHYLDADDIAALRPLQVADAMRRLPGVIIGPRTSFSSRVYLAPTQRKRICEPTVYLDGVELLGQTADLDAFVDFEDIAGLEVYTNAAEVPHEFPPANPLCGAILIWRKPEARRR